LVDAAAALWTFYLLKKAFSFIFKAVLEMTGTLSLDAFFSCSLTSLFFSSYLGSDFSFLTTTGTCCVVGWLLIAFVTES
jgi:hypothetical protein